MMDRQVSVTRAGQSLTIAFPFNEQLVEAMHTIPFASFHSDTRTWHAPLSVQAIDVLRMLEHKGFLATPVSSLVTTAEPLPRAPAGILHGSSSSKRPWAITVAGGDDAAFARLRAISGAAWDKKSRSLTYPRSAELALHELVTSGDVTDPDSLVTIDGVAIGYDTRIGELVAVGNTNAAGVFADHWPHRDVYGEWVARGKPVRFLSEFSRHMYDGELLRHGLIPSRQPDGLKVTLFDYQVLNAAIAAVRDGHAIFDEPGLGKTISGIAAAVHRFYNDSIVRTIVVCPAAVRSQWAAEIHDVTGDDSIAIVGGDKKKRSRVYDTAGVGDTRWLIVHYDILKRDEAALRPLFDGAYVIADEAHRIKSPDAQRTQALRRLTAGAAGRLALTGTPVETSPAEWFDILSGWVNPGILGTPAEFNDRYRWPGQFGGYEGAKNVPELRKRSLPLYTRHTKKQVAAHLPPLRVQHLRLDPDPAYAAALRRAHADAAAEIGAASAARHSTATKMATGQNLLVDPSEAAERADAADMTAVGLLRLLCTSPALIHASDAPAARALVDAGLIPDIDGPKLDHLRDIAAQLKTVTTRRRLTCPDSTATAADVTGERMVVFTCSKRMANLVTDRLRGDGLSVVLFTGDTSSDDRDLAVRQFLDPTSGVNVFVCTDAGAEGLNLGKCCNLLVNLDLAWTSSKMSQRAQRIHRIDGKASSYLVINMTLAGTLESGILQLLENRADLTDALFGEQGSSRAATGRGNKNTMSAFEQALMSYTPDPRVRRSSRRRTSAAHPQAVHQDTQLDLLAQAS